MTRAVPVSALPLSYEELGRLAEVLDYEELGVAIRLIAYQAHSGAGLPDDIAASHLGVTKRRWERLRAGLMKALRLDQGRWDWAILTERQAIAAAGGHPAGHSPGSPSARADIKEAGVPADAHEGMVSPAGAGGGFQSPESAPSAEPAQRVSAPRRGPQALPLVFPVRSPGPRFDLGPAPAVAEAPLPASLTKAAFDIGIRLLMSSGKSERAARDCIARMLKKYDVGFVSAAIDDAWRKRDQVVEPHSWMLKRLQRYPTKDEDQGPVRVREARTVPAGAAARPAHPMATPEFLGISSSMVDRIRAQNARTNTFSYVDPDLDDAEPKAHRSSR